MRFPFFLPLLLISFLSFGQRPTYHKIWESSAAFVKPRAVIYDHTHNVFYVSNMNLTLMDSGYSWEKRNDGFISKLSAKGEIIALKWIDGLLDPAGMFLKDNFLYIADSEFLVIVDVIQGKVIKRISAKNLRKDTPASTPIYEEGSKATGKPSPPPAPPRMNMLTSVTGSPDGSIFIRDFGYKSIYRWRNNQLTQVIDNDQLVGYGKIIWNEEKEALWAVSYKSILQLVPDDKYKMTRTIDLELANPAIGIVKMKNYYLLVTDSNEVYKYQYAELTELFKAADPCECHTDIEVANDEIVVLDSKLNKIMSFKAGDHNDN